MPYRKRFNKKSRKRAYGKRRKRNGKVVRSSKLLKDAYKRGINSTAEKAVALIAQAQIDKNQTILISRTYWGEKYDAKNNEFTPIEINQQGQLFENYIDWTAHSLELMQFIRKQDHQIMRNDQGNQGLQPPENVEGTFVSETLQAIAEDDNNMVAAVYTHGRRHNTTIHVKRINARIRINSIDRTAIDDANNTLGVQQAIDRCAGSWVHCALVQCNVRRDPNTGANLDIIPFGSFIKRLRPFGYSSSLDTFEQIKKDKYNTRVLAYKKLYIPNKRQRSYENYITLNKVFRNPAKVTFNKDDQNGKTADKKFYVVIRGTLPQAPLNSADNYLSLKPTFCSCSKVYYTD